jgi:hypothetical protein
MKAAHREMVTPKRSMGLFRRLGKNLRRTAPLQLTADLSLPPAQGERQSSTPPARRAGHFCDGKRNAQPNGRK